MGPTTEYDDRALCAVLALHRTDVERFLQRRSDSATADEVVSEVLLAALVHHRRGREVTAPWLMRVARNKLIDTWRRNGQTARLREKLLAEPSAGNEWSVEEQVLTHHLPEINALSSRHRELVRRHYVEGEPLGSVAASTNQSYRAVESAIARARRELRQKWVVQDE